MARRRLEGIDLARALAMIGMLMVHVGPTYAGTPAGLLYAVPHGRASILFLLVAGVGVSLLAASRRLSAAGLELRLVWRALLLLPLGLLLQAQEPGVNVILQSYALLFLLAITAAFAFFAVSWRRFFSRGPLELLLFLPWMLPRRWRRG